MPLPPDEFLEYDISQKVLKEAERFDREDPLCYSGDIPKGWMKGNWKPCGYRFYNDWRRFSE